MTAAVLIANSHLEGYYPRPWLAGDGLTGNALFYFLSGFGVALAASTRQLSYGRWMARRVARLYPAVVVAGLLIQIGVVGDRSGWTVGRVFDTFVFPTTYGYVGHIVLVYAGLYWLLRSRAALWAAVTIGFVGFAAFATAYATTMRPGQPLALGQSSRWMHYCYFTAVALAGAAVAPSTARPRGSAWRSATALAVVFTTYLGLKFAMVRGTDARAFPLLFVAAAAVCVLAVRVSADDGLQRLLRRAWPIGHLVGFLATLTLEMYIVQLWTSRWPWAEHVRFPLNLAVFWTVTVAGAVALHSVTAVAVRAARWRPTAT